MSAIEIVVVVLAVGLIAASLAIIAARNMRGNTGRDARVNQARKRRKDLTRRADAEARLTNEVLASADILTDEVSDMRQRLGAEARMNGRQAEREQLADQLAGTPFIGAGGQVLVIPAPPQAAGHVPIPGPPTP